MKALPTSRTEIRWIVLAVPVLFVAHWLLSGLFIELLRLIPESVRAIFHLL
jgi:Na+-transporting NADH:ubiquinone oxidoreductase subunit NqrD